MNPNLTNATKQHVLYVVDTAVAQDLETPLSIGSNVYLAEFGAVYNAIVAALKNDPFDANFKPKLSLNSSGKPIAAVQAVCEKPRLAIHTKLLALNTMCEKIKSNEIQPDDLLFDTEHVAICSSDFVKREYSVTPPKKRKREDADKEVDSVMDNIRSIQPFSVSEPGVHLLRDVNMKVTITSKFDTARTSLECPVYYRQYSSDFKGCSSRLIE